MESAKKKPQKIGCPGSIRVLQEKAAKKKWVSRFFRKKLGVQVLYGFQLLGSRALIEKWANIESHAGLEREKGLYPNWAELGGSTEFRGYLGISLTTGASPPHSCRRATTGSIRVARRAGR